MTISTREYLDKKVYEWLNITFSDDCSIPALNIPLISIDGSPLPNKRTWYTSDPLPDTIYISYEKSVSTLTNPSD